MRRAAKGSDILCKDAVRGAEVYALCRMIGASERGCGQKSHQPETCWNWRYRDDIPGPCNGSERGD